MSISAPPGVFDILPIDRDELWKSSYLWQHVEEAILAICKEYGYQEIRTPLFERTELFKRGVGESSDIVSKEMYTFLDKGDRSLSLRPEATAPVIRAYIEHQLNQIAPIHKLFCIAPMFRYERSQAGRYRQHHQFDVEAIGNDSPEQDVEVIDLLYTLYNRLGLKNLKLCLNSIGDPATRIAYRDALKAFLKTSYDNLSSDSKQRFEVNPLRILDSKDASDRKILENAPSILDFLSEESREHFSKVQKLLKQLKIPFTVSPQLVRGLDYYNKTVFEIVAGELGAQNSIGGGGRYDGLMKQLGGPDLPTIGFGTGLERIIQTLLKQEIAVPFSAKPTIFLIALGDAAQETCFTILHELRQSGVSSYMDFSGRKVGKAMQLADQMQAKYVAVVGDSELKSGEVDLKEMATGEIIKAPLHNLPRILYLESRGKELIEIWQEMSEPFKESSEAQFFIKRLSKTIASTKNAAQELQSVIESLQEKDESVEKG